MEIIAGILKISGLNSSLSVGQNSFWLLRVGFPDPNQAAIAATVFIKNVQHLQGGPVIVTGTKNSIGTQPIIIMSDIVAAGTFANHAMFPNLDSGLFGVHAALTPTPTLNAKAKKKPAKKTPAKKTQPK